MGDFFSPDSVNETKNPIKPGKISVIINPTRVKTKISSLPIAKSVENIRIEVASLTPNPANVIGTKPATFASGKSNIKM